MDKDFIIKGDVNMVLSYVNTKLRDDFSSLDALCDDLNVDMEILKTRLKAIGYEYNRELNKFL